MAFESIKKIFNKYSQLIEAEKVSWVLPHSLQKNDNLAQEQLPLLDNFGNILYLCYKDNKVCKQKYRHYFVTDRRWTIEFRGENQQNATVQVHMNPMGSYIEAEKFCYTNDVRIRMAKVCGSTNYSLALRNCEHVAQYIFCGVWACFQMTGEGVLRKLFFDHMAEHTKSINRFPIELVPEPEQIVTLNEEVTDFIRDPNKKEALTKAEDEMFNILFLGPTGCGKSTLINQLYNKNVCKAQRGVDSVTKAIHYIQGTYSFPFNVTIDGNRWRVTKVNVIDTIGFCDSVLTAKEVFSIVRDSVKVNLAHLDKVIICCSERMEADHKKSIMQFMDWLKYKKYRANFGFFYTKSDGLSEGEKQDNLLRIRDSLDIDGQSEFVMQKKSGAIEELKLVNAISFAPNASSEDISINRNKLMKVALVPSSLLVGSQGRIPVSESNCTIL